MLGSSNLPAGVAEAAVTGQGFGAIPRRVICSIIKPNGAPTIAASTIRESLSEDGFRVSLTGMIPISGYRLDWFASLQLLLFRSDSFDSYGDGLSLDGLGGGEDADAYGFSGPYVDRFGNLGLKMYDTFEGYTNGAALNGLNGGNWSGAYVDRVGDLSTKASDDMESYADSSTLNGLNGGSGFSGPYVDR